jgi:hypothetical protein
LLNSLSCGLMSFFFVVINLFLYIIIKVFKISKTITIENIMVEIINLDMYWTKATRERNVRYALV